jgi:hypothetical protein
MKVDLRLAISGFVALFPVAAFPQTNVYVDSVGGNDANSGCGKVLAKQRLTGATGVFATMAGCGPAPWVVNMRAGSAFPEGPFTLPANTTLAYFDPNNTRAPVTIQLAPGAPASPVVTISTAAAGASLTATTGIDGAAGGVTATPIVVTATQNSETILVVASPGFTNACRIANVVVEHSWTGLGILSSGGTAAPAVSGCRFRPTGTSPLFPPAPTAGGSEHINLSKTSAGAVMSPSISSCNFQSVAGMSVARAIYSYFTMGTLTASITASTIQGTPGVITRGISFEGTAGTMSPSIATTTVRNCTENGIFMRPRQSCSGAPTITGCTVAQNGTAFAPYTPPEIGYLVGNFFLGNGISLMVQDGAVFTPTIDNGNSVTGNARTGIAGIANASQGGTATGVVTTLGGVIRDTEVSGNGMHGIALRAGRNPAGVAQTTGLITTSLEGNLIRNNGDLIAVVGHGIWLLSYGPPFGFPAVCPEIQSVISNCMIHDSVANGIELDHQSLVGTFEPIVRPTIVNDTIAFNGGFGIRLGPTTPNVCNASPVPTITNCIVQGNYNTDIQFQFPNQTEPLTTSFTSFAGAQYTGPPNFNNYYQAVFLIPNPVGRNLHLLPSALNPLCPAIIDGANNATAPTVDFDGDVRPLARCIATPITADRGADEVP